ncbi:MAG: hypothetical protein IKV59_01340 [Lachnospiraceae bacterium]|nr:hypothetical protein [Lachnospiraceae bacterium]
MTLYQRFRKLKINHAAIELGLYGTEETYFCTPKGAQMIGSAGVDGIHYCFVRGQQEMVFAVNPMNTPGKNVHPIARNFEDLLSLLLSCGSMAALEQAYQWDEEQFDEYVADNQPSEEVLEIFNILKEKLDIVPMDEPFAYLRRLQDSYNYGAINFSKEYYELFRAYPIDEIPSEWKVTLNGGFRPKRGKSGKEITLNKQVVWGDEIWHIPAAYQFSRGFVLDFCIQINTERVKIFFHKYKHLEEQGVRLSEEDERKIRNESPTEVDFRPKLEINGETVRNSNGQGQAWISSDIIGDDTWEDQCGRWILEHYGLDTTKAWVIRRCSFVWEERRKIEIESMLLSLERDKTDIPGIRFQTPAVGESVHFVHPISGKEHLLTVQEYEIQEMNEKRFPDNEFEFPKHFAAMTYTIVPELARDAFMLKDCNSGDSPRLKNPAEQGCSAMSVGAIAMIRSSDGPTQVYYVNGEAATPHVICSSLHFEAIQEPIEWQLIFREKMMEDMEVTLVKEVTNGKFIE